LIKIDSIFSPIVASAMKAIDLIESDPSLPGRVLDNAKYFREEMQGLGFKVFLFLFSSTNKSDLI
jgi:hypothetical protein